MSNDRQMRIIEYMNEQGFKPSLDGFSMLVSIVSLSMDEPELSCYELFDKYACEKNGGTLSVEESEKLWDRNYKCCRYALKASRSKETSVFKFVRTCAVTLGGTL